jgi:hypothetical protein
MEMMILPSAGWKRGGDILYVDDSDDRPGPGGVQLFFDTAFEILGILPLVDRYDVMGPSSLVSNSPGGRGPSGTGHGVVSVLDQIIPCYKKIIWCSGNLNSGLIGDGAASSGGPGPEKADDFRVLFEFLDQDPDNPGVYISGDDIANEWAGLTGPNAVAMKTFYCDFNLVNDSHVLAGEPISPCLVAVGACFIHLGVPDSLIAYGGCPVINDFDVLQPAGVSVSEFPYPNGSGDAVISSTAPNSAGSDARAILSGFSYHYIRDKRPIPPPGGPARVHHLLDILRWLINDLDDPTGNDPRPVFANALKENYPNPFNPTTTIVYSIKEAGPVSLKIYNVAGQLVRTLVSENQTPSVANFKLTWDGRNDAGQSVSSGVYFYKLAAKNFTQTKKMVLLK